MSDGREKLFPPCTYQGSKQRLADEIVDIIDGREGLLSGNRAFYDICCGSGSISLELMNRGLEPGRVHMCDAGPWGEFYRAVGRGSFDLNIFEKYLSDVPADKDLIQKHVLSLSMTNATVDTAYKFLLLQAASFGGKQVWRDGPSWRHSSFRSYWRPTETSVRRSPVNPMQPRSDELFRRVELIAGRCRGVECVHADVSRVAFKSPAGFVVYVDPPYPGTTGYFKSFDVAAQVRRMLNAGAAVVYISLDGPLCDDAVRLKFKGPKGGVSGNKAGKGEEWLSAFYK